MLRAVDESEPEWVLGENVPGIINWNDGLVFEEVQSDLEAKGYEVQPIILPACAINADHERKRVFFIAHSDRNGYKLREYRKNRPTQTEGEGSENKRERFWGFFGRISEQETFTDTIGQGLEEFECERRNYEKECQAIERSDYRWENWPTQSPICGRNDGLPTKLDGITFSSWRKKSIEGFGNAVVPQLIYQIYRSILIADRQKREEKTINTVNYAQI
jgi:DNA (cytosine-5)-methyltransferase 1